MALTTDKGTLGVPISSGSPMRSVTLTAAMILAALTGSAFASENGGDRQAAGGAFMSSYSQGAYSSPARAGDPAPSQGFGSTGGRDVSATGSITPRAPRRAR